MKVHRPIFEGALQILEGIFLEGYYADKAIEYSFKNNKKWGKRDRHFVAHSVYEVVRWWRKYVFLATGKDAYTEPTQEMILQVLCLHINQQGFELPEWLEDENSWLERVKSRKAKISSPGIELSFEDWVVEKIQAQYPENWRALLNASNEHASIFIRTNELLNSRNQLKQVLLDENLPVKEVSGSPTALQFSNRVNVFGLESFRQGLFEVQDVGSQSIAPFVGVKPGDRTIDACAGAGGKSLHLAAIQKNKGRIIALDIHGWKLDELKRRGRRAKVDIIETRVIENSKVIKRLHESADNLLLDVPCTGMGVIKRNPDTKWKLNTERFTELVEIQKDILARYSKMVKPGGVMVYSTCSIFREENESQVEEFLTENSDWVLEEQRTHLPHDEGYDGDGFFMAKLRKSI